VFKETWQSLANRPENRNNDNIKVIDHRNTQPFTVKCQLSAGMAAIADPHSFQCGSGSSVVGQCGSGSIAGSRVLMTKNLQLGKNLPVYFLVKKITIYLFLGLNKNIQATEEAISPQKHNIQHFKT
jgi:hypothetical protein